MWNIIGTGSAFEVAVQRIRKKKNISEIISDAAFNLSDTADPSISCVFVISVDSKWCVVSERFSSQFQTSSCFVTNIGSTTFHWLFILNSPSLTSLHFSAEPVTNLWKIQLFVEMFEMRGYTENSTYCVSSGTTNSRLTIASSDVKIRHKFQADNLTIFLTSYHFHLQSVKLCQTVDFWWIKCTWTLGQSGHIL